MIVLSPSSSSFNLLGLEIKFYSVCMFFAIAVSYFAAIKFSNYFKKTNTDILIDFSPLMILISIIGARLYYVLLCFDYYKENLLSAFFIWQGGLSIHGAIIAAIIFGAVYFKIKKLNFFDYADIISLVTPLGQAIGRWGNYFNQEAFGKPTYDSFIALFVDKNMRPVKYIDNEYFHPAFLYESILDLTVFFILFLIMKKNRPKIGRLYIF